MTGANADVINAALRSFLVTAYTPPSYVYTPVTYTYTSGGSTYTYTYYNYTSVPFSCYEWWLVDYTANQESTHYFNTPAQNTPGQNVDLRATTWTQISGVPNRHFAIPTSRFGHGLIYGKPPTSTSGDAWSTVSQGYYAFGTYSNGTSGTQVPLNWFTGFATEQAGAFIADRTTNEKTAPGAADVRAPGAWSFDPNYEIYPLVAVQVQVELREVGHKFTVHGWVPGAPQQLKSVTATAGTPNAALNFVLGSGMQFWITRDAEDGTGATQPVAPAAGAWTASSNANFSALGRFPEIPVRASPLVAHQFRINATTHSARTFVVRMSDGYSTTFAPAASGQTLAYASGQIQSWLDNGTPNHLPIYTFTAQLDPSRMTTVRDTTTGAEIGVFANVSPTDWLDGWTPIHAIPPTDPAFSIQLPITWLTHGSVFQLRPATSGGWISPIENLSFTFAGSVPMTGLYGMAPYELSVVTWDFANPTPYVSGPFVVDDVSSSPVVTSPPIYAGFNDLSLWFTPPLPIAVQISSSRLGHQLAVRHPNGEFIPIGNTSEAGSTSTSPGNAPQYQNYYYFDATARVRTEMPWYVEDNNTGERIGPNPTNSQLIMWIFSAPPQYATAVEQTDGTFLLSWTFDEAGSEGTFQLERRESESEPWVPLDTFPAADTFDPAIQTAYARSALAASQTGKTAQIRVFYEYGGRRSAPSNTVALQRNTDTDTDGMADWWERYHFGSLDMAGSGAVESWTHDGVTNLYKYQNGINPTVIGAGIPVQTEPAGGSVVNLQVFTRLEP